MNKRRKILITGAGGYIGSVSTYLFIQNNYDVVAIDNFSTGYRQPLSILQDSYGEERLTVYETDLHGDLEKVFHKEKGISFVVHYAASCSVGESMENPEKYFTNNVCGTQNLLSAMLNFDVKNIVFSSTCAVYGEADYVPVDEKHPTNPTNPYGLSKRMIEQMIEWYGELKGLRYVILRYFNVCGASDDGLVGDSKKPSVHLIQNAVRGTLGISPFELTCPKVKTKDGTPIRDYINVVDLNEAHLLAGEYLHKGGKSQVINLGTGKGNSVLEIVNAVQKITGKKLDLGKGETRKGEYAKMIADIKKANKVLGWKPKREINESVQSLISWYTKNPNGWKK